MLQYASEDVSLADDEFVFTAPVESFEDFRDWLEQVAAAAGIRRLRLMDEATATVLGVRGSVRPEDRFLIFDFGCGTLDVSAVRLDVDTGTETTPGSERCAVQLGQAGVDLGGMDVDRWLADDFCHRHELEQHRRAASEGALLSAAERVKIALSDPSAPSATLTVPVDGDGSARRPATTCTTTYTRACDACERRQPTPPRDPTSGCLGCILAAHDLVRRIRDTVDRALENAAIKVRLRKADLTAVLVTGGSSLVPAVRSYLEEAFEPGIVALQNPFSAVVEGACQGLVVPILQHEYAIESYDAHRKEYEFQPLFRAGASYPTADGAVRLWARGSYDGMTRIGIRVFEVSRMKRRTLDMSLVRDDGTLLDTSRVASDDHYVCLNRANPTFILADPPISLGRDGRRFLCSFRIDGNRHLRVSVVDNLTGAEILKDHPVVRL